MPEVTKGKYHWDSNKKTDIQMLKYLYAKEIFAEIPDEITLGVSITNCHIRCDGCHSKELWDDKGKPLTWSSLNPLINIHRGISCVCLFGGEHDIDSLTELFYHARRYVRTAWYCGLPEIPKGHEGITRYLDYIKLGPYRKELGGLDSPTTNQRLYLLEHQGDNDIWWHDITFKTQKPNAQ